jgi:ribonuclease BN (tRNA processing enzyme)
MPHRIDRREFLAAAAMLTAAARLPRPSPARRAPTRLILLGTGGGPRPLARSMSSAQVIVAGGQLYVVDCANGVARQLVLAGLALPALRNVFITHHHSDHNADYGNLLLLAWATGMQHRVDTYVPPPIERITRLFFEMSATDMDVRIVDEGRQPLVPLVHAHDLTGPGPVMQDDNVKVTCARVKHPLVEQAYAYRFDTPDRSIVISGDTARSDELVQLARGADVLVHEALYPAAVERLAARVPNAANLKAHLFASHTAVEDVGRVAEEAGVKTLVLSHFVPADDPLVTEQMWADAARLHFKGKVVVGRDLMEI